MSPTPRPRTMCEAFQRTATVDPDAVALRTPGGTRVEQINRFRILSTLWEPGGDEITLTMKLKRKPIHAKYAAKIEELYVSEPGPHVHQPGAASTAQPA